MRWTVCTATDWWAAAAAAAALPFRRDVDDVGALPAAAAAFVICDAASWRRRPAVETKQQQQKSKSKAKPEPNSFQSSSSSFSVVSFCFVCFFLIDFARKFVVCDEVSRRRRPAIKRKKQQETRKNKKKIQIKERVFLDFFRQKILEREATGTIGQSTNQELRIGLEMENGKKGKK